MFFQKNWIVFKNDISWCFSEKALRCGRRRQSRERSQKSALSLRETSKHVCQCTRRHSAALSVGTHEVRGFASATLKGRSRLHQRSPEDSAQRWIPLVERIVLRSLLHFPNSWLLKRSRFSIALLCTSLLWIDCSALKKTMLVKQIVERCRNVVQLLKPFGAEPICHGPRRLFSCRSLLRILCSALKRHACEGSGWKVLERCSHFEAIRIRKPKIENGIRCSSAWCSSCCSSCSCSCTSARLEICLLLHSFAEKASVFPSSFKRIFKVRDEPRSFQNPFSC